MPVSSCVPQGSVLGIQSNYITAYISLSLGYLHYIARICTLKKKVHSGKKFEEIFSSSAPKIRFDFLDINSA